MAKQSPPRLRRSTRHLIPKPVLSLALLACFAISLPEARAEGALSADGRQTRSSLDFRIIIPPMLRLVENSYPALLPAADGPSGHVSALQRVVLVSTMRKGFCMDLRLAQTGGGQMTDWQVQASGNTSVWVTPSDGGYRVCANRAGRYELALQHAFHVIGNPAVGTVPAVNWPVHLDLVAL